MGEGDPRDGAGDQDNQVGLATCLGEEAVLDLIGGRMSPTARQACESHLAGCAACRALVSAALRGLDSDAPSPPREAPTLAASLASEHHQPVHGLAPGMQVDHYEVLRRIGSGAMGQVWLARDTQLGRRVALKVIAEERLEARGALDRFMHEAQTTARFSHPNIVTIYAVGRWRGQPYLALEYLAGQTLLERHRQQPLGRREVLRIGVAIAAALEEAHRHGVLHRDLKPANVLLPADGRPRVLDFGLARLRGAPEDESAAAAHVSPADPDVCGTPAYMAPEQWRGQGIGEAVDLWSLGVVLYELIARERPFRGGSVPELRERVLSQAPAEPLDGPLGALVARCLERDPASRPSAREAREELDRLLEDPVVGVGHEGEPEGPFRGLEPFEARHASAFFGREAEIAAAVESLRGQPMLSVVGRSGGGKTSFVRAGLIPRLQEQTRWLVLELRPGAHPLLRLAARVAGARRHLGLGRAGGRDEAAEEQAAIARQLHEAPRRLALFVRDLAARGGCSVLLFVDQLEELCTRGVAPNVQRAFLTALAAAADDALDPVRVVTTLRDDFLGRLALAPGVADPLGWPVVLRPPEPDALLRIVTAPLAARGYGYDDASLPQQMVDEVGTDPAALPLLQFTTKLLWERRSVSERSLVRRVYDEIGGVAGALARHADAVIEQLGDDRRALARQLLLRLVRGDGTRRASSRCALLSGLNAQPEAELPGRGLGADAEEVLDRLIDGRLIISHAPSDEARSSEALGDEGETGAVELELIHESLIGSWDLLQSWIEQSRGSLRVLRELDDAATLWSRRGERDDELWRGPALQEAHKASEAEPDVELTTPARRFLARGATLEARRSRRGRLRRGAAVTLLIGAAVAASVVALALARETRRAEQQRAVAQRVGAAAALERGDPLTAAALLRSSLEARDSTAGRVLWWRLQRQPLIWSRKLGAPLWDVVLSPDGKQLAAAGADKTVQIFSRKTARLLQRLRAPDQLLSLAFSPDGRRLAAGSWDGTIWIWQLTSGRRRALAARHDGAVWALAFSGDGELLASGSKDRTVAIWRVSSGNQLRQLAGHGAAVYGVAFAPGSASTLASASYDGSVRLWDTESWRRTATLGGHPGGARALAFSPDGQQLAVGAGAGPIALWDVAKRQRLATLRGHDESVTSLAFAPGGRLLASASFDRSVRLWRPLSSAPAKRLTPPHDGAVMALGFAAEGRELATASKDSTLRLWRLDDRRPRRGAAEQLPAAEGHRASIWSLAISHDGRRIVTGGKDGGLRIWDSRSGRSRSLIRRGPEAVLAVDLSPDGKLVASAGSDGLVQIWDAASGSRRQTLAGHRGEVFALGFHPQGRQLASAGADRSVRLWDLASGRLLQRIEGHTGYVYGLSFSRDGRHLATASYDRKVRLFSLERPPQSPADAPAVRLLRTFVGHRDSVYGVAFFANGARLASSSADRSARVWDVASGKLLHQRALPGRAYWLDVHPAGRLLGIPCADHSAHLLAPSSAGQDTTQARSRDRLLRGHRGEVNVLRFSGGGRLAATGGDDGTLRVWDVRSGRPRWRAPLLLPAKTDTGVALLTFAGRWRDLSRGATMPSPLPPKLTRRLADAQLAASDPRQRRIRSASPPTRVCLVASGQLESWDRETDRRRWARPVKAARSLLASAAGCVVIDGGEAWLVASTNSQRLLASAASALGRGSSAGRDAGPSPTELLVVTQRGVRRFGVDGVKRATIARGGGGSAVARDGRWLVIGQPSGELSAWRLRGGSAPGEAPRVAAAALMLQGTPAKRVERLLLTARDTVVAGFANGTVGLWDLHSGQPLERGRLHGPVIHLARRGDRIWAATELGDHLSWQLDVLSRDYCELLRRLWRRIPTTWRQSQLVSAPAPADHACSPR
jgi:WD40 repeat protein